MKYSVVGALLLCGALAAQEPVVQIQEELPPIGQPRKPKEDASNQVVEHPDFEPYPDPEDFATAVLFEQFAGDDVFKHWKVSTAKKAGAEDEFSYVGKWAIEEPFMVPGFKGDKGLVLKTAAAHHAISRKFDKPLITKGKDLVVQYEVKTQQGLQCGGAYVKLLNADGLDGEFNNDTPYQVMFGPDKCGSTDKVHLIIRRKNPKSGEYEEHHLAMPPRTRPGKLSALYTLMLHPDQTFEIRINGEVVKAGSLLDEKLFKPPFTPPKEIDDPADTKPEDWVDDELIPDPDAVKPEDWDEDAPYEIPDPEAKKPADWREDLEPYIPDPSALKPEEWDDEEDGEWIASEVSNPECEDISGCGPWSAPVIKNPDYKGKWKAPLVDNPAYKGEWAPRKIPNPNYYEDKRPSDLEPIGGIGLELWTMQADILFDNFYVGQSVHEAELLGNATWGPKFYVESKENQKSIPKSTEKKSYSYLKHFKKDPVGMIQVTLSDFLGQWRHSPMDTLRDQPIPAAIIGGLLIVSSTILFGILNVLLAVFTQKQIPAAAKNSKKRKSAEEITREVKAESEVTPEVVVASEIDTAGPGETEVRKRNIE